MRTDRKPADKTFGPLDERTAERREADVAPANHGCAGIGHEPYSFAATEQDRVSIEFAARDDALGNRIGWIVLDHDDGSPAPQGPQHFLHETAARRRRHMVQDAAREYRVEGEIAEWQPHTVILYETRSRISRASDLQRTKAGVDAPQLGDLAAEGPVDEPDPATDVQHLQSPGVTDAVGKHIQDQPRLLAG